MFLLSVVRSESEERSDPSAEHDTQMPAIPSCSRVQDPSLSIFFLRYPLQGSNVCIPGLRYCALWLREECLPCPGSAQQSSAAAESSGTDFLT